MQTIKNTATNKVSSEPYEWRKIDDFNIKWNDTISVNISAFTVHPSLVEYILLLVTYVSMLSS